MEYLKLLRQKSYWPLEPVLKTRVLLLRDSIKFAEVFEEEFDCPSFKRHKISQDKSLHSS